MRLEDGGPGIAIARDLKGAVDGDPGVIELALTSHRQIVHMKISRPGDATVVTILDGHLLGIDGRTVEVEHRPFADRQGIEAIGLARFQGRHAAVAPPRGVLVVTGSRRDGPVASEIICPAVGGEAPRVGRKRVGIADEGHILEHTGKGAADVAIGDPGAVVPETTVVAVGVGLDVFGQEGVTGTHSGADDLAFIVHAQHAGGGVALHREKEGFGTLAGGLHRGGSQQDPQQGAAKRLAGLHGVWLLGRGLMASLHQKLPPPGCG